MADEKRVDNQLTDLQEQINSLKSENKRFRDEVSNLGKEALLTDNYLAKGNPLAYECETAAFKVDYSSSHLNQPRMLTVKQVRDVFYSLWNNTVGFVRIGDSELNIQKLYDKCAMLTYDDQETNKALKSNVDMLLKQIEDVQKYGTELKHDNDKRFAH